MTVQELITQLSFLPADAQVLVPEDIYVNGWINHTRLQEIIAAHYLDEFNSDAVCEFKSGVILSVE